MKVREDRAGSDRHDTDVVFRMFARNAARQTENGRLGGIVLKRSSVRWPVRILKRQIDELQLYEEPLERHHCFEGGTNQTGDSLGGEILFDWRHYVWEPVSSYDVEI